MTQRAGTTNPGERGAPSPACASIDGDSKMLLTVETALHLCAVMLDRDGRISTWGKSAQLCYGRPEDAMLGESFGVMYDRKDRDAGVPALHLRRAEEAGHYEFEGWRPRENGTSFWGRVVLSAVRDDGVTLTGFVCITRDLTGSRRSAEALAKDEAFFRSALDEAPIGTAVVALDGRFLWVNRALAAIVGYEAEELRQFTFVDITHPDDIAADAGLARRLAAGDIPHYKLAKRYIRKDGSCVNVLLHASVMRDPEGSPLYFVAQIEDVTERMKREAQVESLQREVAKQAETYRTIVRHLPNAAVFLMDETERFVSADGPALLEVLSPGSLSPEDVVGISLEEMARRGPPENSGERSRIVRRYREALRGVATREEVRRGSRFFDVNTIPICDLFANPFAVLTLCYDVTESRLLHEALIESERQQRDVASAFERSEANLRMLLEKSPVGVAVTRGDQVTYANRSFSDMLRYDSPSSMRGRRLLEFVTPDQDFAGARHVMAPQASGSGSTTPVSLLAQDGGEVFAEASSVVVDLEGGPVRLTIFHDVTARRRIEQARDAAEAALRTSLQEKDVLLREVHHRVKNNLQVVSSLLSLEARRGARAQGDPLNDAFVKTQMRVRSIAVLHESLYQSSDVSRLNMADYLATLVGGILRTYGEVASGVHVDTAIADVRLTLDDAVPCGLIVNELVTNAMKHAFPAGTPGPHLIHVEMRGADDKVELTVSDNGRGFDSVDPARPATLGMQLVASLAGQLDGGATFSSERGVSCKVWFPRG